MRTINDKYFQKILEKMNNGTYKKGKNCKLTRYYFERMTIDIFV